MNDQVIQDADVTGDSQVVAPAATQSGSHLGGAAVLATVASAALAACGGGGDTPPDAAGNNANPQALLPTAGPTTQAKSWRFLNQASLGPNATEVSWVSTYGIEGWLSKQFAIKDPKRSYVAGYTKYRNGGDEWDRFLQFAWWEEALATDDQLRTRVVNALLEILVVSLKDDTVGFRPIMMGHYMDVLAKNAFGNFRELIEAVCKAPAMGAYLSHLGNQPPSGNQRIPDQNFARELIQLFTIGLTKLNMDGTQELDGAGRPQPSTKSTDIPVLSNAFTGWALDDSPALSLSKDDDLRWFGDLTANRHTLRQTVPMKGYTDFHSTDALVAEQLKLGTNPITFLGQPFGLQGSPQASLTAALNVIFQHQNVAPFIAKQMIQRLVTSNPTPGYVQRVATAFKDASWDMKTLVRAILTDTEARSETVRLQPTFGKLREPLFRVVHLLRAFGVGIAFVGNTDQVSSPWTSLNLNQSPMRAPSVFNYFSPNYTFVGGLMANAGKVTPEMQIATEASVIAYVNAVYDIVSDGLTQEWEGSRNGQLVITTEVALAATPSAVVDSINTKLFGGTMTAGLVTEVTTAATAANTAATATEKVKAAIFVAAVSPEYLVQK
jgi:uncharacterized protein (DUF1800 family)